MLSIMKQHLEIVKSLFEKYFNFLKIFSSVFQFRRVFIKIGDIVPVEAGGAQTAIADGAKFIDGQKAQRVGIYITAKLIHALAGRDQFLLGRCIHSVKARRTDHR